MAVPEERRAKGRRQEAAGSEVKLKCFLYFGGGEAAKALQNDDSGELVDSW